MTKQNTGLTNCLNLHKETDSACYFNGNVFGTTKGSNGKHFKFDLFPSIDNVIARRAKHGPEPTSEGAFAAEIDH